MKFLAEVLATIGNSVASIGIQSCVFLFMEEITIPKCLIEK